MNNILIGDIGGTNARFALATSGSERFTAMQYLSCADFATSEEAIRQYLSMQGIEKLDAICVAVAGAVVDQQVNFTNNHWSLSRDRLVKLFDTQSVTILNDFEAIAYSLPFLSSVDVKGVGGDWPLPERQDFKLGVLGPGTGLGVSGLFSLKGVHFPVIAEGGHTGFAPENSEQTQLLAQLQSTFGRVSNEKLLCGAGIVNVYESLVKLQSGTPEELTAADIGARALAKQDAYCEKTMALFFEILGQVAGDLVLTLGALDGVFVGGGICQRYADELESSLFRQGFTNKGLYAQMLDKVPTWLITNKNPGLIGASSYAKTNF